MVYNKKERVFKEISLFGETIEDAKIYKIGLQYYFYLNLKDFFSVSHEEVMQNAEPKIVSTSCRAVLEEYLSYHQNLDHQISGRLEIE